MVDITENFEESFENRRRHFRLTYPPGERPVFKVRKYEFDVVDISQSGLRFVDDQDARLGRWVSGNVVFPDGEKVEIDGKIVWNYQNIYGIEFLIRIPFKTILKQQKIVIKSKGRI